MSNALPVARLAVHLISSVGVSKVINDVIKNNTDVVTTADAVKVAAGSIVIGSMIAEHASKHVNERVNEVFAWYKNRKDASTVTQ
jgi:hypothetical protein